MELQTADTAALNEIIVLTIEGEKMEHWRKRKWLVNEVGKVDEVFAKVAEEQDWRCPLCTLPLYVFTEVDFDFAPSGELRGILCEVCHGRLANYEDESARSSSDPGSGSDAGSALLGECRNVTGAEGLKELGDASTNCAIRKARATLVHSGRVEDSGFTRESPKRPGCRQTVWRIKPPRIN
jgi:hypothetical protein